MNLAHFVPTFLPDLPAGAGWRLPRQAWSWVPIRGLAPRHRPRILQHLLALDAHDRYLRFGYPATDAQVARYVELLDFARDEVFGIFDGRLQLVAMAHLAYSSEPPAGAPAGDSTGAGGHAEFGVSVQSRVRARGYGARLFEHAVLHARNRGVDTLLVHALTENTPMLKIARHAGAAVQRLGAESEAVLALPPDTLLTRVGELVGSQAAEFDYRLKRHARRVDALLEAVAEVKSHLNASAPTALE